MRAKNMPSELWEKYRLAPTKIIYTSPKTNIGSTKNPTSLVEISKLHTNQAKINTIQLLVSSSIFLQSPVGFLAHFPRPSVFFIFFDSAGSFRLTIVAMPGVRPHGPGGFFLGAARGWWQGQCQDDFIGLGERNVHEKLNRTLSPNISGT